VELVGCLLTAVIQRYLGGPDVHLENVRLKKVGSVQGDGALGGDLASFPMAV
jgi:hypothetical protein